ncbi:MAG TPA: azurin [Luteimonas sp.]|nr:azurin [Luteimonas sp.]
MKLQATLIAAACALALAACGNDAPPPAPATDAATPAADEATPATDSAMTESAATDTAMTEAPDEATAPAGDAAVVTDCSTTIGSNDAMQYSVHSIAIPASCSDFTITLEHTGQMPVAAMGHNVVISAESDMAGVLADGMAAGLANDYVKAGDTRVLAHTRLIGGGESTSVTFPVSKLQGAGPFVFFCSFPGHSSLMKGTVTVQ